MTNQNSEFKLHDFAVENELEKYRYPLDDVRRFVICATWHSKVKTLWRP